MCINFFKDIRARRQTKIKRYVWVPHLPPVTCHISKYIFPFLQLQECYRDNYGEYWYVTEICLFQHCIDTCTLCLFCVCMCTCMCIHRCVHLRTGCTPHTVLCETKQSLLSLDISNTYKEVFSSLSSVVTTGSFLV